MTRSKLKELYMECIIGNGDPTKYLESAFNSSLTKEEIKQLEKEVEKELNEFDDFAYYKLFVEKYGR